MGLVRVKICGLGRPGAAREVVRVGADAIGLVFAESVRRVSIEQAKDIVAAAGSGVLKVGVFVDADAGEINRIVEQTGITHVQLHGREQPGIIEKISVPCWKAFRVRDEGFVGEIRGWLGGLGPAARLEAILLDTYSPDAAGGTGRSFNWHLLSEARDRGELDALPPIVLAGGLDAANVAAAVATARPWAVDVSSGVEESPGLKDLDKVAEFIRAVRQA